MSFLVQNALLGSLIFTVLSGVIALGGRSLLFHKLAQVLLVVSGTLGIVASFILSSSLKPCCRSPWLLRFSHPSVRSFRRDLLRAYLARERPVRHLCNSVSAVVPKHVSPAQPERSGCRVRPGHADCHSLHQSVHVHDRVEVMSMASFFLVMSDRSHDSIRAALLYLIMTHLGAAAILIAFLLLAQGSLFVDFSTLADMSWTAPVWMLWTAFSLFFFGFGSKGRTCAVPCMASEAHPSAPSHVSALMSGVMLKVALYGFLRVLLFILPPIGVAASLLILGFGLLTALYGVLYAVVDRDFKRTLAFSSIENIGLIFTMLGVAFFASSQGLQALYQTTLVAAVFFMIAHAIFKSGLFLASGLIVRAVHSRNLELMGGLAKRLPLFSVLFCVLCLAAASLPPFGPFFGEWMFFQGSPFNRSLPQPHLSPPCSC